MKYENREFIKSIVFTITVGSIILYVLTGIGREISREIRFTEQMHTKCFNEKGYWVNYEDICIFNNIGN